jgi:integrase
MLSCWVNALRRNQNTATVGCDAAILGSAAKQHQRPLLQTGRPSGTSLAASVKHPRKYSPEEVVRFLEAAPGPKYKAALSAAYGAGLRVSELVALKVSDVDSEPHASAYRAGQGQQGPLRDALPTAARAVA